MGDVMSCIHLTTSDVLGIIYFVDSFFILNSWTPCMYLAVYVEGLEEGKSSHKKGRKRKAFNFSTQPYI